MDVTIQFDSGTKPAAASSKDDARPHLEGVWLERDGDRTFAISTDSYKLVKIPVTVVDGELPAPKANGEFVAPLWLPNEVVNDVTRGRGGGQVRITDDAYEPLTPTGAPKAHTYRRTASTYGLMSDIDNVKVVKHRELWPEYEKTFELGINPQFLLDVAKAMGAASVSITFDKQNIKAGKNTKPVIIRPLTGTSPDARALLMPVQVNV